MPEISGRRSLSFFLFFSFVFLQLSSGISDDSSSKEGLKTGAQASFGGRTVSTVVTVSLVLVAIVLLSFFLFKLWQKKKRKEQYARLLKLFDKDDELELELGLRD